MKKTLIALLFLLHLTGCVQTNRIDLSGSWTVRLDSTDTGLTESWQGVLSMSRTSQCGLSAHNLSGVVKRVKLSVSFSYL